MTEPQSGSARPCLPQGVMRVEILRDYHDDPLAGHFGAKKTA
jgi:hypothetical protein